MTEVWTMTMTVVRTLHVFSDTSCVFKKKNSSARLCMLRFASGQSGVRVLTAGRLGSRLLRSPSSGSCNGKGEGPRLPIPQYCLSSLNDCPDHSCSQGCECRTFCARLCSKANVRLARDVNPPGRRSDEMKQELYEQKERPTVPPSINTPVSEHTLYD